MRCGGRETKASKASVRNPRICISGCSTPSLGAADKPCQPERPGIHLAAKAQFIDRFEGHQVRWPVDKASIRRASISRSFEFVQLMDNGRALWRAWLPSINFLKRTTSTSSWFENEIRVCKPRRRSLCGRRLVQPNSQCSSFLLVNVLDDGRALLRAWLSSGNFLEWTTSISSGFGSEIRVCKPREDLCACSCLCSHRTNICGLPATGEQYFRHGQ